MEHPVQPRRGLIVRRVAGGAWFALGAAALGVLCWAWLGGWQLNVIETGSMTPTLQRNSLAVVVPVSPATIEAGDVIAFQDRTAHAQRVIHRVQQVIERDDARFFETRGDANSTADAWLVPAADVDGKLSWRARHLGAVIRVLRPPGGAILLVGVPLLVLIAGEVSSRRRPGAACPTCGYRAARRQTMAPLKSPT